jgi:hypothetical protein
MKAIKAPETIDTRSLGYGMVATRLRRPNASANAEAVRRCAIVHDGIGGKQGRVATAGVQAPVTQCPHPTFDTRCKATARSSERGTARREGHVS